MNSRRNRYLEDRAMRRGMQRDMARGGRGRDNARGNDYDYQTQDERNPYGSRGGYVVSSRGRRGRDREMDNDYDYARGDRGYDYQGNSDSRGQDYHYGYQQYGQYNRPMEYEMYGVGGIRPYEDYDMRGSNDYGRGDRGRGNYDYGRNDYGRGRYDYDMRYDYANEDEEYKKELKKWIEKLKKKETKMNVSKEQIIQQAKNMGVKFDKFDEEEFYAVYLMLLSDYKGLSNDYTLYLKLAKDFLEDEDAALQGSEKVCAYLYTIVLGEEE